MEIRKSGKITIGILAALGTIGALHMFLFKNQAADYAAKNSAFTQMMSQYASQGRAPNVAEINKFKYDSLQYKLKYWETLSDMNLFLDSEMVQPANIKKQRQQYWDQLRRLKELRASGERGEGIKLSFMGSSGWNIAEELPAQLIQQGIDVEDVIEKIRNENRLLTRLDKGSEAYYNRTRQYAQLLAQVGMFETGRDYLSTEYGELVATYYVLNQIDLVVQALPPLEGEAADRRLELLYDLFRVKWPVDKDGNPQYFFYGRQGRTLVDMIERAQKHGVQDIAFVKLHKMMDLVFEEFDPDKEAEEAATDPMMMDMGMGGFGAYEMGAEGMIGMPGMGMPGMGKGGGMGAAAAPVEPDETTGYGTPIEILTVGENASVMKFLYEMTHDRVPIELDKLQMRSNPAPNSPVQALGFFNVVVFANMTIENGTPVEIGEAKKRINDIKRDISSLALQPGSGELAVQDGIAIHEGGPNYRLIEPSPTPWGQAASNNAPPPAQDPASNAVDPVPQP